MEKCSICKQPIQAQPHTTCAQCGATVCDPCGANGAKCPVCGFSGY